MNWKLKSGIQNTVAALPSGLSYQVYYFLQRRFGGYREANPVKRFEGGIALVSRIRRHGGTVEGRTFLEVGTGHQINVPIALWLCGAPSAPPVFRERLARLARLKETRLQPLLDFLGIRYLAPADAARLPLPDGSVDYHISYTVLEHIPPDVLAAILREGRQVLRKDGLFVHFVDFSDHFSHSDKTISPVNFLQFSE